MDWTILSTNFEFYALIGHILFFEVYDHSSVVFIATKYLNNYLIKNAHLTDLKVVPSSKAIVVKKKSQNLIVLVTVNMPQFLGMAW